MIEAILVNYNYTPDWLLKYSDLKVTLYDRSDDGIERDLTRFGSVFKTENIGDVDFDKLSYLVENYDNLPEVFLWGKSNIHKYVDEKTLKSALRAGVFQPLLKYDHQTYSDRIGVVCRYHLNMYEERADSWFFNNPDLSTRCPSWAAWIAKLHLPGSHFIPFAPGGNYVLTRERVHRYGRDFYEKLRDTLPHAVHPAEAHAAERSYYLLWR